MADESMPENWLNNCSNFTESFQFSRCRFRGTNNTCYPQVQHSKAYMASFQNLQKNFWVKSSTFFNLILDSLHIWVATHGKSLLQLINKTCSGPKIHHWIYRHHYLYSPPTHTRTMEVKENNSFAGEWPSTHSLQQKADDGLYRLTTITFKFSFFPNVKLQNPQVCFFWIENLCIFMSKSAHKQALSIKST